jgi:hypothetical protein
MHQVALNHRVSMGKEREITAEAQTFWLSLGFLFTSHQLRPRR